MATKSFSSADVQRPSAASIRNTFNKTAKANKPSQVFSLIFCRDVATAKEAAQARYEQEQLQGQRSPVKDVQGNLYTGLGQVRR